MRDLLFEIGTEEIPAGYLKPAFDQIEKKFTDKAAELNIGFGEIKVTGTPRRFALMVKDVEEKQPDIKEELLGPSKKAALDDSGNFTKAAQGFARSKGADVSDLQVVSTPKGEYMQLVREVAGKDTLELLPSILQSIILDLSFPKSMKWGDNKIAFARPIQWLLALFGKDIVPLTHEKLTSSNKTCGHRFLANEMVEIRDPSAYLSTLGGMDVIVDYDERRNKVLSEIESAASSNSKLKGGRVSIDEDLVDTVTNLVETPVGVCGTFDDKFLQLVPEVLITSMREHQKYFPVVSDTGELLPGFVAVNNTIVKDTDVTRKGHQRVLRARLEDALFFFNKDKKTKLIDLVDSLSGIIFQAKLGTMLEKKERLVKLSQLLAEKIDPNIADTVCRAAMLCKVDLLSDMVGEFPSLQGVMGAAYALNDGEDESVATGVREHYMPKRAGAEVPGSDVGAILALADRIDTIVGCFGIGQKPTGTADPFGLRRIALAILSILREKQYKLSLEDVFTKALALYGDKVDGSTTTVREIVLFVKERFANDCVRKGINAQAVAAAVSVDFDEVNDSFDRITAISEIHEDDSFGLLAGSYKRMKNIVKDNTETVVDEALLEEDVEKELYKLSLEVTQEMEKLVAAKQYLAALQVMLRMKDPVDQFFDQVMVMAEDEAVRSNRLNLLTSLSHNILKIGDISKFQD